MPSEWITQLSMSGSAILLLKAVLQLQQIDKNFVDASVRERERAAELLRKVSAYLSEIEGEIRAGDFEGLDQDRRISILLKEFQSTFSKYLGDDHTRDMIDLLITLFGGAEGERGKVLDSFELLAQSFDPGRLTDKDSGGLERHINACISVLTICAEQLEACADVIENGRPDSLKDRLQSMFYVE